MSDIVTITGNKIRYFRMMRRLTQETLAALAGINITFLGQIERGDKNPTIETIDKILTALDVSYEEFYSLKWSDKHYEELTTLTKNVLKNDDRVNEIYTKLILNQLENIPEDKLKIIYEIINQLMIYNETSKNIKGE